MLACAEASDVDAATGAVNNLTIEEQPEAEAKATDSDDQWAQAKKVAQANKGTHSFIHSDSVQLTLI